MTEKEYPEPPSVTAEMLPLEMRSLFYQTDEMLKLVDPSLRKTFRFGLAGHVHGPEYDDPRFEADDREAMLRHQAETRSIDSERQAATDLPGMEAYMNYWVTSAALIYRHFEGREDSFVQAEDLADSVLDDLNL